MRRLHVQTKQKKHTRTVSNISKVNNKETIITSDVSVVNFEHVLHFILLL